MTVKGHVTLSVPILIASLTVLQQYYASTEIDRLSFILFSVFVIFGSVLPDIDEPGSYIGRKLPIFSNILSIFISHRGITHFLCVPMIIFTSGVFVDDISLKFSLFGLAIGVFAHTIGDLLTVGGINGYFFPFFPTRKAVLLPRFLRFYTNSFAEYVVISLILMCTILTIYSFPFLVKF